MYKNWKGWEALKAIEEDHSKEYKRSNTKMRWNEPHGLVEFWNECEKCREALVFVGNEWEEVKTPYNFIEAYDECKNEGKAFRNNHAIMQQDPSTGKVYVECFGGGVFGTAIYLETEWYEY